MHSAKLHTFFNRYSVLLVCFDGCFSIDVFSSMFFVDVFSSMFFSPMFFHRCFFIDVFFINVFPSMFFHRFFFVDALFLYIDFMSEEAKFTAIHVALRHLIKYSYYRLQLPHCMTVVLRPLTADICFLGKAPSLVSCPDYFSPSGKIVW